MNNSPRSERWFEPLIHNDPCEPIRELTIVQYMLFMGKFKKMDNWCRIF